MMIPPPSLFPHLDDVLDLLLGEDIPGWISRVDYSNPSHLYTLRAGCLKRLP